MKKTIAIFLTLVIFLVHTNGSFANARYNYQVVSQKYTDSTENNSIYLVEKIIIDGELYTFTHKKIGNKRVIEMTGAENRIFTSEINADGIGNKITLSNDDGKISIRSYSNKWYTLPESRDYYYGSTEIGQAALATALASLVGGPVAAFLSSASVIIGAVGGYKLSLVVYTGGKYRPEGTHIRYKMTSRIYYGDGRVTTARWGGLR